METPSNGFSLVAAMRMCVYSACIGQQYKAVRPRLDTTELHPERGRRILAMAGPGHETRRDTPVLHPERGRRILAGPDHTKLI